MDGRAIARWRTHTLRIAGQHYPSVAAVVDGMLAVQAENHAQASWAVATRVEGPVTEAAFGDLFDDGVILRTHVLRPTWHYVRPDDIRWLLDLTAPRIRRSMVQEQRELGIDDATIEAALTVIADALAGGRHLTRETLGEHLADAGLPGEGQPLGVIMTHAEIAALVCSGAVDGRRHTYALLEDRAPGARVLDREDARAEIVLRYFTGHGPATERDLAYWASMTLTDVRAGLADVGDQLDHLDQDGRTYWYGEPPPEGRAPLQPRGHLLQVLDEYHNGYQDSRDALDVDRIVPAGRRATVGMVLVDTQMVGGMRRRIAGGEATFALDLHRRLTDDEVAVLRAAADRYGEFLGMPTTLTGVA